MNLSWRIFVPCLALLFALSGCAGGGRLGGITVKITDLTVSSDKAEISLSYANDNIVAIAVSATTHELSLNGKSVGKVRIRDTAVGLPQLGMATQKITLKLDDPAYVQGLGNSATYELRSELLINNDEERIYVKTKSEGTVALNKK